MSANKWRHEYGEYPGSNKPATEYYCAGNPDTNRQTQEDRRGFHDAQGWAVRMSARSNSDRAEISVWDNGFLTTGLCWPFGHFGQRSQMRNPVRHAIRIKLTEKRQEG